MSKKGLTTLALGTSVLLGTASLCLPSKAANIQERAFSFYNMTESSTGTWREKNDSSKVYIYPKEGPKIFYTVQGNSSDNGSGTNRSNIVAIPKGVQGSVTNTVNESGETWARLKYQRINASYTNTTGVWAPDSLQNYTIYN